MATNLSARIVSDSSRPLSYKNPEKSVRQLENAAFYDSRQTFHRVAQCGSS